MLQDGTSHHSPGTSFPPVIAGLRLTKQRIAMYLGMQSPTAEGRAHAKKLVLSKDHGKAWLKGGWRNEPKSETLGRDIGLPSNSAKEEDAWFEKARKGMEKVNEGLGVF